MRVNAPLDDALIDNSRPPGRGGAECRDSRESANKLAAADAHT